MIARVLTALADMTAEDVREAVVAAAFFTALIWNLPLIIAVAQAAFEAGR